MHLSESGSNLLKNRACLNVVVFMPIGNAVVARFHQFQGFLEQSFSNGSGLLLGTVESSSGSLCFLLVTASGAVACLVLRNMVVPGKIPLAGMVNKL